jgi:hypothetical protein
MRRCPVIIEATLSYLTTVVFWWLVGFGLCAAPAGRV